MTGHIATLSLGDAVVVGVALVLAGYEAWLFLVLGRKAEHGYLALTAAAVAAFAAVMGVHYNLGPEAGLWASRVESMTLTVIVSGVALFAMAVTGRAPRGMRTFVVVSALVWSVVAFMPWHIAAVEMREVYGLDGLLARRVHTFSNDLGVLWGLAISAWAVFWLYRHRTGQSFDYGYGVAAWVLAGIVDALSPVLLEEMLPSVVHYGFLAFVLTLVGRDARRYLELLGQSRRDFNALIEQTPDAVMVVVGERIVWVNVAATRVLGQGSLVGRTVPEVLERGRATMSMPELQRRLRAGSVDIKLHAGSGQLVSLEAVGVPVCYEGEPATVLMARDTTDRQLVTARLMEMDRMITAGTLSAGIGHEINNPLSYALVNVREAQLVLRRGECAELELPELLADAEEGLERIRGVVVGLRSFTRSDEASRRVHLAEVIRSATAISGNEVRLRARLIADPAEGIEVRGGQTRLGQIMTNLLVNAAHSIPMGDVEHNVVRVSAEVVGADVVIRVSDTGCGMSDEVQRRCFEPFFTTKAASEGTGLGLSICQDLARELDGDLTVESRVGDGTTFTLRLPGAMSPARSAASAPEPETRIGASRARVLIVDDERATLRALSRSLRRELDITTAASVDEALEAITHEPPFDLILSDLIMPNQTGGDLLRILGRRWPELAPRVVFMTGGVFTEETRLFSEAQSHRILHKPVAREDILEALARAISQGGDLLRPSWRPGSPGGAVSASPAR